MDCGVIKNIYNSDKTNMQNNGEMGGHMQDYSQ